MLARTLEGERRAANFSSRFIYGLARRIKPKRDYSNGLAGLLQIKYENRLSV